MFDGWLWTDILGVAFIVGMVIALANQRTRPPENLKDLEKDG